MEKKYNGFKPNHRIWISTFEGEPLLGEGRLKLLQAIQKHGSLQSASDNLGVSYRKAWDGIKKMEEKLGCKLVVSTRGGSQGGATELTSEADELLKRFESFVKDCDALVEGSFHKHFK